MIYSIICWRLKFTAIGIRKADFLYSYENQFEPLVNKICITNETSFFQRGAVVGA